MKVEVPEKVHSMWKEVGEVLFSDRMVGITGVSGGGKEVR